MATKGLSGVHLQDAVNGYPVYLGTVAASTTSKTNHETATPFNNTGDALKGKVLLIHNAGTVDVRIHPVSGNTGTTTNTRVAGFGVPIHPGERVIVRMGSAYGFMAVIATSSTANVDFWELL